MAYIQKRGNTYRVRVSNGTDQEGRRRYESTTWKPAPGMTERQEQKALAAFVMEFERKVKTGNLIDGDKTTFKEFSEIWFRDHASQTLEQTTLSGYKLQLDKHIMPEIGQLPLSSIQPYTLQKFLNRLSASGKKDGSGLSRASLKQVHAVMSSIFETAKNWQLIESNPCQSVKLPKVKDQKASQEPKHFTIDQAQRFLDFLNQPYTVQYKDRIRKGRDGQPVKVKGYSEEKSVPLHIKLFIYMAMFTGARREELLALTWEDVDIEKSFLTIEKATTLTSDGQVIQKDTKNNTSRRIVTLQEALCFLLAQWKAEQMRQRLQVGLAWEGFSGKKYDKNYIFTQWNGKQLYPSTPYQAFKKIIKRYNENLPAGAEPLPDIPLHGLRHTNATLTLAAGVDTKVVSERLGHKNIGTTLNIYGHVLKSQEEEAAETLAAVLLKPEA